MLCFLTFVCRLLSPGTSAGDGDAHSPTAVGLFVLGRLYPLLGTGEDNAVRCCIPPNLSQLTDMFMVDVRGEVRRFGPGHYTLMHDRQKDTQLATLDSLLYFTDPNFREDADGGGATVYVVGGGWGGELNCPC